MNNFTSIIIFLTLSLSVFSSKLIAQNYLLDNENALGFYGGFSTSLNNSEFNWATTNIKAFKIGANYTIKGKWTISGSYNSPINDELLNLTNSIRTTRRLDLGISYKLLNHELKHIPVNFLLITELAKPIESTPALNYSARFGSRVFHSISINDKFKLVPIVSFLVQRDIYKGQFEYYNQDDLNYGAAVNLNFRNTYIELSFEGDSDYNRYELMLGYIL